MLLNHNSANAQVQRSSKCINRITAGVYMNWLSLSYDFTTASIETFTRGLDTINRYFLGLMKDEAEMEGLPVSEA